MLPPPPPGEGEGDGFGPGEPGLGLGSGSGDGLMVLPGWVSWPGVGLKGGGSGMGGAGAGAGGAGDDKKKKRRVFSGLFADQPDDMGPVWDPAHGPGSEDDGVVFEVDLDEWGL